MASIYYSTPGGVLLLDGETGKCLASAPSGGAVDVGTLLQNYEKRLMNSLKTLLPTGAIRINAYDEDSEDGSAKIPKLPFRVEGEGVTLEGVLDETGSSTVYLKPGEYTVTNRDRNWVGPGVKLTPLTAGALLGCSFNLHYSEEGEYYEEEEFDPELGEQV